MFRVNEPNLIFQGMPEGCMSKIMEQPNESDNGPPATDKLGEIAGGEGCRCGVVRRSYPKLASAVAEVIYDCENKLINLMEHPNCVLDSSVRRVYKNSVGQPKLLKTIEPLHRRSVKNLQLRTR
jgi:hypothetical protein